MVKVRNGVKSNAKKHYKDGYATHLCQKSKLGIAFFCSSPSRIESGRFIVLLSAVSRQCTLYRTVVLKNKPDAIKAEELLRSWAQKLPLNSIK